MNRAQRRAAAKATPAYRRGMTREDKLKALYKNGITVDDLKHDFNEGHKQGYEAGVRASVLTCYCAACMALHKLYGFGRERLFKVLQAMDQEVLYTITSDEAVQKVLDEVGIRFNTDEPFERIEMVKQ